MAVEVNHADGTVVTVDGAEERKSNGVVTSKSDQTRECFSLLGWAGLVSMGVRCAAQEEVVAFLDLLERVRIVVPFHYVNTYNLELVYIKCAYEVTGISPQSMTLAHELKGFAFNGTL